MPPGMCERRDRCGLDEEANGCKPDVKPNLGVKGSGLYQSVYNTSPPSWWKRTFGRTVDGELAARCGIEPIATSSAGCVFQRHAQSFNGTPVLADIDVSGSIRRPVLQAAQLEGPALKAPS